MRRAGKALLTAVLLALPAAGFADTAPNAVELLDQAYAGPAQPYQGRVLLTQYSGRQTSSEEVNVSYAPPGRYRLEFLTPEGTVDRVVIGDGQREQVQLMKDGKVASGYRTAAAPRLLNKDEERKLLLQNYKVSLAGSENVMGRAAWIVELTPKLAGKPSQRMWIDKDTKAVLEVRRALDAEKTGATSRFTRFEIARSLPEGLFGYDEKLAIRETSREQAPEAAKADPAADRALSGGFALAGSDLFDVKGEKVRHLRYTDGLIPVSLFVTRVPVDSKGMTDAPQSASTPMYMGLSSPMHVNQWKQDGEHYTLMGEVAPELLKEMAVTPSK